MVVPSFQLLGCLLTGSAGFLLLQAGQSDHSVLLALCRRKLPGSKIEGGGWAEKAVSGRLPTEVCGNAKKRINSSCKWVLLEVTACAIPLV